MAGARTRISAGRRQVAVVAPVTFSDEVEEWVYRDIQPNIGNTPIFVVRPSMIARLETLDIQNDPASVILDAMFHASEGQDLDRLVAALRAMDHVLGDPWLYLEMLYSHFGEELIMAAKAAIRAEMDIDMTYQPSEREL